MRAPDRRWTKAALAAALAAASIAFAAGAFVPEPAPARAGAPSTPEPAGDHLEATARGPVGADAPKKVLARTDAAPTDPVTLVATGDIACDPANPAFNGGAGTGNRCRAKAVARVITRVDPQALLTLGDHQYDDGRAGKFQRSYDLSYGAFKAITYPSVGNHEYYSSPSAQGFFDYFGERAGTAGEGWYSLDLGAWHLVALNSNCTVVGCGRGTPQYTWLQEDLAENTAACTLAFWHAPRFSSGPHGPDRSVTPFWRLLRADDADVVLNGHDHIYERFRPQDASGDRDPLGLREFVVGTGGAEHYWIESVQENSLVRDTKTFGVLRLTLGDGSYDWRFEPALGAQVPDAGTAACV
jgi:hypothetical protein